MDRIGPAVRSTGRAPEGLAEPTAAELRPLLQRHTIIVGTGDTSRALAFDSALNAMSASQPLMDVLLRQADGHEFTTREIEREIASVPTYWTGHLALLARFDLAAELPEAGRLYRSGPTLVIHRQGPNVDGGTIEAIDIVQNPRRSFRFDDGVLVPHPSGVWRAGVWDTAVEGSLLAPGATRLNTAQAFALAEAAKAPVKLIRESSELEALKLPSDTLVSMRKDLDGGNALLVAEHSVSGVSGWWRVNATTGETVGQIGDGRGSEIVEGIALAISIGLFAISAINCGEAYDPETLADVTASQIELACCGFVSTVIFGFGMAIGVVHWTVGAVYGSFTSFMPYPTGCAKAGAMYGY